MKIKFVTALVCIGSIFLSYWQGIGGLFMLDDVVNLQMLYDQIKEGGFWAGVTGGHSGPTGRPVALWTFALQASCWPNDPASFKVINIVIHILNTMLMAVIIYVLLPHIFLNLKDRRFVIAIFLSAFWALLPIQISTVLYVVQRMVLLSSMFMLLAIVFYLWARAAFLTAQPTKSVVIFCVGVGSSSLLAILSKESGLLLFAFLITIEMLLQQKQPMPNANIRKCVLICLALPLALFAAYIVYKGLYQNYDGRTFNLVERVLTQPRILLDYLQQIILPVQSELGLYHDDYLKSTGLLSPESTLMSIIFWLTFAVSAVLARWNHKPWLFFAFFWFISGHLMESTILPLELYFEHRNYLSSMGILVGLMGLCLWVYSYVKSKAIQKVLNLCAVIYPLLIMSISLSHISLWGSKAEYMLISAKENPTSLRARMLLIDYFDAIGDVTSAKNEIQTIINDFPYEVAIELSQIHYACRNSIDTRDMPVSKTRLLTGRFSNATESTILKIIDLKNEGRCPEMSFRTLIEWVDNLLLNNNYRNIKMRLLKLKSVIYFSMREYQQAIDIVHGLSHKNFEDNTDLVILYSLNNELEEAEKLLNQLNKETDLSASQRVKLVELNREVDQLKKSR